VVQSARNWDVVVKKRGGGGEGYDTSHCH